MQNELMALDQSYFIQVQNKPNFENIDHKNGIQLTLKKQPINPKIPKFHARMSPPSDPTPRK